MGMTILLLVGFLPISALAEDSLQESAVSVLEEQGDLMPEVSNPVAESAVFEVPIELGVSPAPPTSPDASETRATLSEAEAVEEKSEQVSLEDTAPVMDGELTEPSPADEASVPSEDAIERTGGSPSAEGPLIALIPARETDRVGSDGFQPLDVGTGSNFYSWYDWDTALIGFQMTSGHWNATAGRYETRIDGQTYIGYCLNADSDFYSAPPQGAGTGYSQGLRPGLVFFAALIWGYPTRSTIEGYVLTDDEARQVTQFVIWCLCNRFEEQSYALLGSANVNVSYDPDHNGTQSAAEYARGEYALAAARALHARLAPLGNTPLSEVDLSQYFDLGTIHAPADTVPRFWDDARETLRSGPFTISSELADTDTPYSNDPTFDKSGLPAFAYIGDVMGNQIETTRFNSDFYVYFNRNQVLGKGALEIQVTLIAESPAAFIYEADNSRYQTMLTPLDPDRARIRSLITFSWDEIAITKLDSATDRPVASTEFTLYSYPVTIVDDVITTDVTAITADDPSWTQLGSSVMTDVNGRASFPALPNGYYMVRETLPNPNYATCEESGGEERFIRIDADNSAQAQIFRDDAIQLSCEIFTDTINVTSSGFRTSDEDALRIENVGIEPYHYTLDFRSTSNVRADEFTVVDSLDAVATGGVRLTELFTPVARGDSDGFFNLWYQTNLTDSAWTYSSANAMNTNPFNVNNPDGIQNWPSTGWQLWQEALPTTSTTHLDVENLGLAPDEYITALRFEYGSVEVGFTTRDTLKQSLQTDKELKSVISDWSENQQDSDSAFRPLAVSELRPATYLVTCSTALLPPTVIRNSATVNIARNVVLSDRDEDAVRTGVIEPFMIQTKSEPPTDVTTLEGFGDPLTGSLPVTGDNAVAIVRSLALLLLFAVLGLLVWDRMRSVPPPTADGRQRMRWEHNNRQ
jgi:TQXA domain-containing protein